MDFITIFLIIALIFFSIIIILLFIKLNNFIINKNSDQKTIETILTSNISETFQKQMQILMEMQSTQMQKLIELNNANNQLIAQTFNSGFKQIQDTNNEKLDKIQEIVDNKMEKTLNQRLDSNFKQVGQNLADLHQTLGELNQLSTGILNLNKTLSNVKTRGIWGEIQLEKILEQTMTINQYEKNIITKPGTANRVEFAIKIPKKNDDGYLLLPIDSKFPGDLFSRLIDASKEMNKQEEDTARKELAARIKQEAKDISSKYISDITTPFGIMFLPTESLYTEILQIDNLMMEIQKKYNIIIAGPTTLLAIINSLQVGFSNLALSKKSQEIFEILKTAKTQYQTFCDSIEKTQKKIDDTQKEIDNLKKRADIINKKLQKIDEFNPEEEKK